MATREGAGSRLFLSYRREDSGGYAGRLADLLIDRFGAGSVFVDADAIEAGADVTAEIEPAIFGCEVVLVVIDPGWLEARTPSGSRGLDDPEDVVRRVVEAALASEVRVIPVLVGGASMPVEAELPEQIAGLARRNAVELLDRRWREDVDALIEVLEGRGRGGLGNLPLQQTPFVGREREFAELTELMRRQEVRLFTLTGPGGIGKTRLAVQAAMNLAHTYSGGAWLVGLASVTDPDLVLVEVARVLEIREVAGGTLVDAIATRLSSARTLMVLDNVEHLLPDAASPIAQLSAASASLDLLVTSRRQLHVTAERVFAVGTLGEDAAVDLFVDRARASGGDVTLSDDAERAAVAAVCARLDGLPLAIELAASRTRLLDPRTMLERLEHRLAVLTGGASDLPARQQTLRATIDWSHELLRDPDRRLFARLSVFSGGWTLEAAEAICSRAEQGDDVLDGLETLERSSLIHRQPTGGRSRFTQLETVREYASERLQATVEFEELSRRHAGHFLSEAELSHEEYLGPHPQACFERIERELGNFRAAIGSSLAQGRVSVALRIMAQLLASLEPSGYWKEALAAGMDEVVARSEGDRTPERAEVLFGAGSLAALQGRIADSRPLLQEAIELATELDDRKTLARALARVAWVRTREGEDIPGPLELAEAGARAARELGDPWVLAEVLNDVATVHGFLAYSAPAVSLLEESLAIRRSIAFLPGIAGSLNNLGWQALLAGDYERAVGYLEECLEIARELAYGPVVLFAQSNLGLASLLGGDPARAEERFLQPLPRCREMGDPAIGEEALVGLAGVAVERRDPNRAAWLAGAADALLAELGLSPSEVTLRIRERYLPDARRALGDEAYERAYERGRRASFDDAVAYALDEEIAP